MKGFMATYRLVTMLVMTLVFGAVAVAQPSGYKYSKSVTINASQVQGTNTDFPVLISVTDANLSSNVENSNGYDIIFTSNANGTGILSHELESFNSGTGKLTAWVKVPSISSGSNTTIYMFYGRSSGTANTSTTATWDTNFKLVMHMEASLVDATSNGNNGSNNGTGAATGLIGNARDFERNNDDYITVADDNSLDLTNQLTISFWLNLGSDIEPDYITKGQNESYEISSRSTRRPFFKRNNNSSSLSSGTTIAQGSWVYLSYVKTTTQKLIYINGNLDTSHNDSGSFDTNSDDLQISRSGDAMDGLMDEIRISSIPRSANWIKTEYNNQLNPGAFITLGPQVEYIPPTAPQNVLATSLAGGNLRISFDDVDESGSGVASYSVKRSATQGGPYTQVGTVTDNESAIYYFDDSTVSNNVTYYYVVTAIDGDNNESVISAEVSALSDGIIPPAPTNVSATSQPGGGILIAFDDVDETGSGVKDYSIQRSTTQGGPYSGVGVVTDNESASYTYTDNSAVNGTSYYYVVVALDGANNVSLESNEVSDVSDGSAPNAPNNVVAAGLAGGDIQVSFDDVDETGSGVASYSIRRSTTQGGAYTQVGVINDNESSSYTYTDNTVSNGTTYYYVVATVDAVGNTSSNSSETSFTADSIIPVLQSATAEGTMLVLDYNEPLESSPVPSNGDFVVKVNNLTRNVASVAISNDSVKITLSSTIIIGDNIQVSYTAGTNPIQDISGNDAVNLTNQTVTNNTPDNTAPPAPTNVAAFALVGSDIDIKFDDVDEVGSGVVSYSIRRATVSGGPYSQIGTITDIESVNYTYTDNTASIGTTYYYIVVAIDASSNESTNSSEVTAESGTVTDATAPSVSTTTVSGNRLILDYSEDLNENSVPSTTDYVVKINGSPATISAVDINGDKVSIDFTPSVDAGDNITVDYTAGVNPIRDIVGNNANSFTSLLVNNSAAFTTGFGPDPCPIVNGKDAAWTCFDGSNNGTTMRAEVGGLEIATITAASGSQTTFSPNALQSWTSGAFSGDEFNGPQINATGNGGNATSFDINIPVGVPSDAIMLSLNRLRPDGGGTSYTLEAFDGSNTKVPLNGWLTGQGSDGGVCTNSVNINYANGNTTIQFQPTVSGVPACASSSTPVWFKITNENVRRIELRKTAAQPDNIYLGLALVADFGDAPNVYGTSYSSRTAPPAFHLLNNDAPNVVYFGAGVDADGNGIPSSAANNDVEDAIVNFPVLTSATTNYSVTLSCTNGGNVGAWIDFDQSGSFDAGEFDSGICSSNSVTLNWSGLSGMITGTSYARFRIASSANEVATPTGSAKDGEVEDYQITISEPKTPDLSLVKSVNNSTPIVGETITYTLTVTNPGEYIATDVRVTDVLPAGVTFVSSTASQGNYNNVTGVWIIGNFAAGDTTIATLDIEALVDAGTLGSVITNSSSISNLNETDLNLANNSSETGITVVPESADIGITKIASNANPIEGEFMSFTVSVTNNGPKAATNLKILDQLPTGITYQDSLPSVGIYNPSTGIWDIGNLANGASASLILNVRVDGSTQGNTINNTAALNGMDQSDSNSQNNTATASITIVPPIANLSCGLPYLKFRNASLISGSALQIGAVYKFPNVLTGVYAKVEIVTINNATIKNIDDGVTSGLPNEFSPFIENTTGGNGYLDFEISFYDSASNLSRYLSFAATTSDVDGTGDLKDFVGYQNLNSFIVENTTELVVGTEGLYTTFTSNDFSDTSPNQNDYSEYKVYTSYTNEPKFRLRAGIKAGNTVDDRIISVNFDPCEINTFNDPVTQSVVDVGVTKSVDDNSVTVGQTVTYTVQAANKKANAVGSVKITDQLPGGLTYVSSNPSQGTYNSGTGIWDVGSLSGLQVATIDIVATVNTGQQGNTITNTATLSDNSGVDGVAANNTASVAIAVFDPNSGLSCTEPPKYSFINYNLEQGSNNQVNSIYRFSSVASGVDAKVKIIGINNATITALDDDGTVSNGQATTTNFSPLFTTNNGTSAGYIDWEITFVEAGTNTPFKSDFSVTALDIDGTNSNGQTIRDYYGFAQNLSSTVQAGNNINISTQAPYQIFESSVTSDANGSFDIDHMAYISYKYTSVFQVRSGSFPTGGYSSQRMVEFNFTQCLNQEFTNPVITTRDADLQVTKTVDQANPLENETVNFTISVKNNGPEDATEVSINEALPAGITLVEAVPSQGTYNQITKLWNLGTLANNATATLALETTINQGLSQDSLINKAYVKGFNQYDPTIANDTSQVVLKVSVQVTGTVFRDKTGDGITDGDTNFGDASGDQQALENVEVHLFKDGGDGLANGVDDIYKATVLTNNQGKYVFQIGENAPYWIAVDSKTGGLSNNTTWAEQTYAPINALCNDGNGGTDTTTVAGNCFGGRRGGVSDNISTNPVASDLANAEHVAKVAVNGGGTTGIDFGFSFNVVTDVRDGDDDGSTARSIQGSLRQFIANANAITGANSMRFVPAVPTNQSSGGGNWWSITASSAFPAITDALTTVDGSAFDQFAPTTEMDDNSGSIGTGGSVGLDLLSINSASLKELELNLNDIGASALNINSSGAVIIRDLAIYNNSVGIQITSMSGGTIENNMIGTRANGVDPTGSSRLDKGISVVGSGSLSALITKNYIAYANTTGVAGDNPSSSVTLFKNEVYKNGLVSAGGDGIEIIGTWSVEQNLIHESGNSSSSPISGGNGIEIGKASGLSTGSTIRNNTIINNSVAGINVFNNVTNTVIEKNIITGNGTNYSSASTRLGAGIKLTFPNTQPQNGIKITNNSFANNYGLAIDIVTSGSGQADGVSGNDGVLESTSTEPNRGIDYPVFTLSTLNGSVLHVEGYIGTVATKLSDTYTIEVYKASNDGDNNGALEEGDGQLLPHGEGQYLLGTITSNPNGYFSQDITVPGSVSLVFNDRITAIAIGAANNTSEFSANQRVVPTGVSVNGTVYHDTNYNSVLENGEAGIQGVTIVLFNVSQNNCKSVLTDANGFYQFDNVLNGQYQVIEAYGEAVPTPNICTPAAADPTDHVSTNTNLRDVTINNLPSIQNFGDFEGTKVQGKVFKDNGIGSGIPNDAVQNGGELGLGNVIIQALNNANSLIRQTTTNASGAYTLYLTKTALPNGSSVKIKESNLSGDISTGGKVGNSGGTYNIADDEIVFISSVGFSYTELNFGDVSTSTLLNDGQRIVAAGSSTQLSHIFEAKTGGNVTFTTANTFDPSIIWPVIIYRDLNCNSIIDSGEPVLDGNTAIAVTANEMVCIVVKVTAPNGLSNGASSTSVVTASFALVNTTPLITQTLSKTDLVTVDNAQGGFTITKVVDKNSALPGSILTYTVTYLNNGSDPISTIKVSDTVPAYTTFNSAAFATPLPDNLTGCTITAPAVGATGQIKWEFTGTLLPGQSGTVSFTVKINQ
mgnify:CR=1 FL=1